MTEYKRLGSIINDGRLAGLIDWSAIEDRTRNLITVPHWESPADIISAVARQYRRDTWEGQRNHVECWVEKEALAGVFEQACKPLDVAVFPCRGYVSQSEMWVAAQRLSLELEEHRQVIILHFGDHDPSGIDMTRDITDRLSMFLRVKREFLSVKRIALNMDQVEEYKPPPNPAKDSDARFESYLEKFGDESWELDALEPQVLRQLIENNVAEYRDEARYNRAVERQRAERTVLEDIVEDWENVEAKYGESQNFDEEEE